MVYCYKGGDIFHSNLRQCSFDRHKFHSPNVSKKVYYILYVYNTTKYIMVYKVYIQLKCFLIFSLCYTGFKILYPNHIAQIGSRTISQTFSSTVHFFIYQYKILISNLQTVLEVLLPTHSPYIHKKTCIIMQRSLE